MSKDQQHINQTAMLAGVIGQVGCVVVIIIGLALGAGILLDRFLETRAIFTVLFMVGSVPVALYITVRISMTAVSRAQQTLEEKENANQAEENTEA